VGQVLQTLKKNHWGVGYLFPFTYICSDEGWIVFWFKTWKQEIELS
jgi:hypothetical protein